jgi:transcriptional regulator with XRE-family HTH domain
MHPTVQNIAEVGKIVRSQRLHEQLRIDDAAALCGVSVDLLSRLENGGRVTTDRLLKVLDSLGLSVLIVPKDDASILEKTFLKQKNHLLP